MPAPSYSPTDVIVAFGVLVSFVLDMLTGFGVLPAVDPTTRTSLIAALTVLTLAGTAAYVKNRQVKHDAVTAVEVAKVSAPLAPALPAPAAGPLGPFVLTPVPAETSTTGGEHPVP